MPDHLTPDSQEFTTAIIEWLMTEGRALKCPQALVAALSGQLADQGIELVRMRISLRTLHPQFVGSAYTWWRGREAVERFSPPHSILQSDDYRGSPIETVQLDKQPFRCHLSQADIATLHSSLQTFHQQGVRDYVVYPLQQTHDSRPATWILATDREQGFSAQELEGFRRIALFLAPVVEVLSLELTARSLLDTYLGHRSGQRVFDGQVKRGDGELIQAAIWYSDLRNFTAISESLDHQALLGLLNSYFEIISDAVAEHGGEVLRFIGDAMLVIFPSDQQRSLLQASRDAVAAAYAAQAQVDRANPALKAQGLPEIRYGLGLDLGEVIYGNVGAPNRLDFTVMGPAVNRAARIEELTKKTGCPVLASGAFAQPLGDLFSARGAFSVPGVGQPIEVYRLEQARPADTEDASVQPS